MKTFLIASAALSVVLLASASAQSIPTLSEYLTACTRDTTTCRLKMKDYVVNALAAKVICLPKNVSETDAGSEMLSWLRSSAADKLSKEPYDDALYEAAVKLYPCGDAAKP
ncbi:hypothetical protein FHS83_001035 [Rhizomicrobium palustre]|uniref:Rap1a immunity protein domain-containing protein n=1 Tax=Rhizomicrobium palustre TaxID=189966 RepID=A0A846MXK9_9PROT|nr:hypothetical protein [Rhizomicrobium palustre]NIK87717.1 hypothetical protein [Rhizomicrobium palustre]